MKTVLFSFRSIAAMLSLTALLIITSASLTSCTFDDTELQNSIDDLTSRIEALEDFREQVQGDISSLQDIIAKLEGSVTVNNVVDNGDGSWTINFSDGTSVTIRNGQDGEDGLTPPSITVVKEDGTYYWAYENADGTTDFILDDEGNRIPVTGEAPQVRINDEGYWEISTDGGQTWEGTGVKAEGSDGDSFFKEVYVEDGILYLVLADDTVIEVPMTAELSFDFGTDEEVLYFMAGETKELAYAMSGQESVTVNKPDGWRVSFQGSSLSVTAPAEENVYAETEGAISVILISASGQSLLAEQKVAVGEAPEAIDLSAYGTANCYIVPSAGRYSFDATVIGNGADGILEGGQFHTSMATISPASAELVWQSEYSDGKGLVSMVTLESGKVIFNATGKTGNANIAVKDADGNILWSWHIWCVGYDASMDVSVTNHEGETMTLMGMNLGATSADHDKDAFGLYYQWGRKDPFISVDYDNPTSYTATYDINGNTVAWSNNGTSMGESIEYAVNNPTTFILGDINNSYSNWTTSQNDYLWGDPLGTSNETGHTKTIYDPCPPGYTVPDKDAFTGFTSTGEINFSWNEINVEGEFNEGLYFITDGSTVSFFPAAGYRVDFYDQMSSFTQSGCYWTASPDNRDAGSASSLYFNAYNVNPASWDSRANAFSVRCMKYDKGM
ncbi:MAG: hypothetical protein IAB93_08640 [Bacteroidetes bacterium]|uniref:DUF4988 domain-containing protein n=1 Tax=Candidatus Merdivivens pullistercoris TaxID=2840873 RepID=A0A9D9NAF1_9BACT|nr:hypothetical protein [Candidatus Merdivivens pullistercoris]